ncbi:methyltransferase domain-containing protein [Methylovulum psychrotolerans]|uniref:Bifunctional demethylmenaquinone methyltransferase/2-methoxy-6-polyprenyl-1,4-benzoquinol methylase UbiE n=1 Tax=Methylovulum psychrotolerans TaxID=1704499 RepID=A0A1Z4C063_9GAMM|nr:methyltransferase domain-containing protein [Methylovulum psychrotolerans]ASF46928.1 hypothetical protein CEK71_13080 [Methylovulum psychrotolerans]POZ52363.1 bifunctional demethylmenaquinone methyltransferase/2-methoxy-6-polyprenyl-1,4-benzoquinol methylase UbiE [Methylovulum psychrotolerans]
MPLPKGYIDSDALDKIAELLGDIKQSSYAAMDIQPSHKVFDLGCGPGTDTIPLASLVGREGLVVGVDYDADMLVHAQQRAEQAGVATWVRHEQADAMALPFADNYFDSARSERVFQHLPEPTQALSELVRVTKPQGWVVIIDPDWGSFSIDSEDTDIERRIARYAASPALNNGYSGRTLNRLFKQQGLTDIRVQTFPVTVTSNAFLRLSIQADRNEQAMLEAGLLSPEELQQWRSSQAQADAEGVYFAAVNIILCVGRKP